MSCSQKIYILLLAIASLQTDNILSSPRHSTQEPELFAMPLQDRKELGQEGFEAGAFSDPANQQGMEQEKNLRDPLRNNLPRGAGEGFTMVVIPPGTLIDARLNEEFGLQDLQQTTSEAEQTFVYATVYNVRSLGIPYSSVVELEPIRTDRGMKLLLHRLILPNGEWFHLSGLVTDPHGSEVLIEIPDSSITEAQESKDEDLRFLPIDWSFSSKLAHFLGRGRSDEDEIEAISRDYSSLASVNSLPRGFPLKIEILQGEKVYY